MVITTPRPETALVAGAAGIIGDAVMRELDGAGWAVCGLSRRQLRDHPSVQAERGDAEATAASLLNAIDSLKRQNILP